MKPFTIRYRLLPFLPFFRTISGEIPSAWPEVKPKQLIAIASLYKNRISEVNFLAQMMGVRRRILTKTSAFERYMLMEYFVFIKEPRPFHEFILNELVITQKRIWGWRRLVLYPPKPKLHGMTFGQFIYADSYFSNYLESNDENDLNKFIASIYLKENETFSEKLIDRAPFLKNIPAETREAIVINYQLIHEWLTLAYPLIFRKKEEEDSSEPVEPGTESKRDPNIWIKIFRNFVGDDILHDDDWANKPVKTIFDYMTRKYKENAKTH